MPKKLSLLKHVDLKQAIAEIITNPKKKLEKTKERKVQDREILLSNIITIYHHLPKTIRPNRLFCNSYIEPYCDPQLEQVEIQKRVEST